MHIEAGVNCVNDQIASLRRSLCELRQDPMRQSTNESKKYLHRNRNELRQAINAKMPEGSRYAIWTEYVHWSLGELRQATNVKEADASSKWNQSWALKHNHEASFKAIETVNASNADARWLRFNTCSCVSDPAKLLSL